MKTPHPCGVIGSAAKPIFRIGYSLGEKDDNFMQAHAATSSLSSRSNEARMSFLV